MRKRINAFILVILLLTIGWLPFKEVFAQPSAQSASPSDVINAVNDLRLAYGMTPLNVHPVLMQVAQIEAEGIASGKEGHWRPNNLTLGQWLMSLGYPLAGDLTLDGYRSENWVNASTADEAVEAWLGDAPHTNTMLSPNRSDIGAGVAGNVIVLETALQTSTGKMQSDASPLMTQSASGAPAGNSALESDYVNPVVRNTARPDGDVYHKVKYGQSLWSIAITYGTTINNLRALNNLSEDAILQEGQLLLVQRGATQPPPPTSTFAPTFTPIPSNTPTMGFPEFPQMTIQPSATKAELPESDSPSSSFWVGILVLIVVIVGFASAFLIRPTDSNGSRR